MKALVTLTLLVLWAVPTESISALALPQWYINPFEYCKNLIVPHDERNHEEVLSFCIAIIVELSMQDSSAECHMLELSMKERDHYSSEYAAYFVSAELVYNVACRGADTQSSTPTDSETHPQYYINAFEFCNHMIVPNDQRNHEEVLAFCLSITVGLSMPDSKAECHMLDLAKQTKDGYSRYGAFFDAADLVYNVVCGGDNKETGRSWGCGKSNELLWAGAGRIVGGTSVRDCSVIPWQVVLSIGPYMCGGSIISDRHILTAAHCLEEVQSLSEVKVTIAEHDLDRPDYFEEERDIKNLTRHEHYNPHTFEADIAILTLKRPIRFNNPCVQKICRDPYFDFDGLYCTVSGWGSMGSGLPAPGLLQMVKVKTHSGDNCAREFNVENPGYVSNTQQQVCAGYAHGGKDSCQGDSGGPLMCLDYRTNTFVQVGIVSYGAGCAEAGFPGVYSNVAYFHNWIEKTMAENWY